MAATFRTSSPIKYVLATVSNRPRFWTTVTGTAARLCSYFAVDLYRHLASMPTLLAMSATACVPLIARSALAF
jgi:hypothetical protein